MLGNNSQEFCIFLQKAMYFHVLSLLAAFSISHLCALEEMCQLKVYFFSKMQLCISCLGERKCTFQDKGKIVIVLSTGGIN